MPIRTSLLFPLYCISSPTFPFFSFPLSFLSLSFFPSLVVCFTLSPPFSSRFFSSPSPLFYSLPSLFPFHSLLYVSLSLPLPFAFLSPFPSIKPSSPSFPTPFPSLLPFSSPSPLLSPSLFPFSSPPPLLLSPFPSLFSFPFPSSSLPPPLFLSSLSSSLSPLGLAGHESLSTRDHPSPWHAAVTYTRINAFINWTGSRLDPTCYRLLLLV